jgi:hypothetical protein
MPKVIEFETVNSSTVKRNLGFKLLNVFPKIIALGVAIFISYFILYEQCLSDKDANPVVATFFSIVALACLNYFGLRTDKIGNIPLSKGVND